MCGKVLARLVMLAATANLLVFNGCSMIGLTIGALNDASKPKHKTTPVWQVETVKPGTPIELILKDGNRISGKYTGLHRLPTEEYVSAYARSQEQKPEGVILPALGESITIHLLRKDKQLETMVVVELDGFERDMIAISKQTTDLSQRVSQNLSLNSVTQIVDCQGNVITGEILKKLITQGEIPVWSAIAVQSKAEKLLVTMDKVQQLQVPVKKNGKLAGFLIGASIDVIITVAISNSLKPMDLDMQF